MTKRPGEVTPSRAAKILGVHVDTVYQRISDRRFLHHRRTMSGRHYLQRDELVRIRDEANSADG